MTDPKITDNDDGEITATVGGKEVRGWSYADDDEHRLKMRMAHEFAEGWFQNRELCAKIAEEMENMSSTAEYPYDGGAGSMGYEKACRDISTAIRNAT